MDYDILTSLKSDLIHYLINERKQKLRSDRSVQQKRLDEANTLTSDKQNLYESPLESEIEAVELNAGNLDIQAAELGTLRSIPEKERKTGVAFGALVRTNTTFFLIAVPFPEIVFKGYRIRGISTQSPLFQKMEGFKEHTEFHLGRIEYVIFEIV